MSKLLSLSRAARLAGVSRGELQKRIREEDLKTFEGELTVELLLQLYPHIDLEADPMLEKVRRIRAEAKPKTHYSDGWMPDPEVLMTRLEGVSACAGPDQIRAQQLGRTAAGDTG